MTHEPSYPVHERILKPWKYEDLFSPSTNSKSLTYFHRQQTRSRTPKQDIDQRHSTLPSHVPNQPRERNHLSSSQLYAQVP